MKFSPLTWATALLSLTPSLASAAATITSPNHAPLKPRQTSSTACNNSPELCSRNYNNITHLGAHDSSFLRDESTDNSVAGNQFFNATEALNAGFRLLQAQVHNENGTLRLCHSSCSLLDAGPLQDWLKKIAFWMDNNANEVVTILLVNSDGDPVDSYGAAFQGSGLSQYGYVPETAGSWPTLGSMISSGKRLVTFVTSITESATYPYLLNEFTYVFETAFEVTSSSGFNCTLDRPSRVGDASTAVSQGMMSLANHFLYKSLGAFGIMIPDVDQIANTNNPATTGVGMLGTHATQCRKEWGARPNFILVDFFNEGPAIDIADVMNDLTQATVGRETTFTAAAPVVGTKAKAVGALAMVLTAAVLLM
ncbi:hypothetical protein jhhlp_001233 [Lomentospora prolificans]|uniref:Phosphatidylinositol-specific phospholipase C X domain-containing protein n=1 Tax=Lomentospora prolificans TaxID=41688 RepID=A0A2N3NHP1_9PEZI|nr:hypothetical protein jhhlp_001233 [Lomentospora prolificans]